MLAAACNFQPIYASRTGEPKLEGSRIAVDIVPGEGGFALREQLIERLGAADAPTHRLAIDLAIREEGAAITRDDITTRYLVLGTAAYRLDPIDEEGEPIIGSVVAQTAYSAPASDTASAFATRTAALAAEERVARTLADRVALRLSVFNRLEDAPVLAP